MSEPIDVGEMIERLRGPFPNKGLYPSYDAHWNRAGYADLPHYAGQMQIRFPEDWSPFMCFLLRDYAEPVLPAKA